MTDRVALIREKLTTAFAPTRLDVVDESHLHAGHAGAATGLGHFSVVIVADAFTGHNLLARHRMVYEALGDAMKTEIHALSVKAYTPQETQA